MEILLKKDFVIVNWANVLVLVVTVVLTVVWTKIISLEIHGIIWQKMKTQTNFQAEQVNPNLSKYSKLAIIFLRLFCPPKTLNIKYLFKF